MSSYYTRRFYRRLFRLFFVLIVLYKPIIGALGLAFLYFCLIQMSSTSPVDLYPHFHRFYYSESSLSVDVHLLGQEPQTVLLQIEHGPILSAENNKDTPWYQRLGFIQYHLKTEPAALSVFKKMSGSISTGHYFDCAIYIDDEHDIQISGESHPLSYSFKTLAQGNWVYSSPSGQYEFKNILFSYEDPVTWLRLRLPTVYLSADKMTIAKDVVIKDLETRFKLENPGMKSTVYGSLYASSLKNKQAEIKDLRADLLMMDAHTYYVQQLTSFFLGQSKNILSSADSLDWSLEPDEFIQTFENLYPKASILTVDGVMKDNFDFQINQNDEIGLEMTTTAYPQQIREMMRLLPWVSWDPHLVGTLSDLEKSSKTMVSVVWNPADDPAVEIFSIYPNNPMLDAA